MSQAKDTLLRLFALLRLIPTEPRRIATPTLLEKLRDKGFSVTLRSIQRDLNRLSVPFSLQCDDSETPFRWSFTRDAPLKLEDMDAPTALALYLSESHLNTLLPQTVLDQLSPQFRRARNFLGSLGNNGLADWARRVRAIPYGKTLLPAVIAPTVWDQVSTALLERKQLDVAYQSRSKGELKRLRLHPAGLVSRHAVSYLLASVDGYGDLRQFALHRIREVRALDEAAESHATFDVDDYIDTGIFSHRQAETQVELIADVHPQIAALLSETPLSTMQSLSDLPNQAWKRLHAQVALDRDTLWWIFGLNDNIRVHAPQVWVDEIQQKLGNLRTFYSGPDYSPHA
ncbi:WYL domain-containing protein [Pseudomonas aeruginosa]|uniref:helix-turn-helix transcriptional regulator n=1 Tax=Pseudomonas aeruginosa TaxID=287 RepID=UPI00071C17C0|nr:WYL domain-containing protein [Pseudomonas aeruginosa]KSN78810.1 WYL domain-containing protein [Pseudomonas aeruginosa]KSR82537.1 WYL domain-containing protein [Pseudomonas aeruginosa]MBH9383008.1 WYL domain-containing protein [Pseudomonas aeruginosa]MDA3400418.1 WYL domain-containing protein [Pseudomonas aeruginosa]MDP5762684.1 WYL domain-containing protein [Pseudomonas aeruginosa]